MHVQPQIAAESLHGGQRAAAGAPHAIAPQEASHAAKDLAQEQAQHPALRGPLDAGPAVQSPLQAESVFGCGVVVSRWGTPKTAKYLPVLVTA